jgi:hypothetical protein
LLLLLLLLPRMVPHHLDNSHRDSQMQQPELVEQQMSWRDCSRIRIVVASVAAVVVVVVVEVVVAVSVDYRLAVPRHCHRIWVVSACPRQNHAFPVDCLSAILDT